ncbi:acetate--CoA ligase family protein [Methylobacterium terricola]|uniref:Acetate--CoA ligase family protein n=1 Tax=Methylobacterium terricola TaxID=2583531 RepID=A0A5C4LNK5_9HYPH|nr:acetate--CoA ligase family protein [Methylobacterium terricola]TNC15830.1 acetate--CoA ligase family protein [Methylobacterium terricola]
MTSSLQAALDPGSIAVIGASENPDKIGGRPLLYLSRFGFRGEVWPVNPRRDEVQGRRTVPRLSALSRAPDLAIIAVPGEAAVAALDECGAIGVKVAIMMASGFGETADPAAQAAERAMVARARSRGLRMIGPNAQGLANFGTGAVASFSSMFLEAPPQDGPVGIVSQSGAMSVVPYGLLRARGIGVRHTHATGNDADVTVCELAAAVAADPALRLLLLYLESIPDPHHLAEAAAIARDRGLPIVALKSGRTAAGQAAAQSHTGALANEDRLVDAFLERHGIWRARDTTDLVAAAELYLKGWRPGGRRLVAISNSGATCVMAADAATSCGLDIAPLREDTQGRLRAILPSFAATRNPVDITAALMTNSALFGQILPVIAADPSADAFLVGVPVAGRAYAVDDFGRDTAAFAQATGKPVVIVAPQEIVASPFRSRGLPVFPGEGEAVRALHQLIAHRERMAAAAGRPPHPAPPPPARTPPRLLDEAESLGRLARAGVPVVRHRLCRTAEEAVAASVEIGGPVAVKGCSAEVAHKSELGLVHLGVSGDAAVRAAFEACRTGLAAAGHASSGVIVAAMARGRRELVLGAHRDPVFGPVVMVGDGGTTVEAMPDVAVLLPPFSEAEVERALGGLRIAPLIAGVRGEPPLAVAPYLAAAVAVGRLMVEEPAIASLDLNPILVGTEPGACMALDAVVFVEGTP